MKWRVQGADRTTGRNVGVIVDAMNQEEAAQTANAKGMLVASVQPADIDIPLAPAEMSERPTGSVAASYAAIATPAPHSAAGLSAGGSGMPGISAMAEPAQPSPRRVTIPNYDDIINSAGWLNGLASCMGAVGWVAVLGFLLLVVRAMYDQVSGPTPTDEQVQRSLAWVCTALICGLVFLGMASIMRMLAATGLAVRDMSRNSFRREQQQQQSQQ